MRWVRQNLGFVLFMLGLLVARSSFADHYVVPSGSMERTLFPGDRVFVDKRARTACACPLRWRGSRGRCASTTVPAKGLSGCRCERGPAMAIELDHVIVSARNQRASSRRLAEILGVRWAESGAGPFSPVYLLTVSYARPPA